MKDPSFRNLKFCVSAVCLCAVAAVCTLVAMVPPHSWFHNTVATTSCFVVLGAIGFGFRPDSANSPGTPRTQVMTALVMLGLLFSILGDWLMNIRGANERLFIFAIAAFWSAHLCFLSGFLANGKIGRFAMILAFALLLLYLPYYFIRIAPAIPSVGLKFAVMAYLLVSVFSLTAATTVRLALPFRILATVGICMIVFSDTLIAERTFAHNGQWSFLIIPTYILTHLFMTLALVFDRFPRRRSLR